MLNRIEPRERHMLTQIANIKLKTFQVALRGKELTNKFFEYANFFDYLEKRNNSLSSSSK